MDVHNLSAADVQFLLERKFDYDRDERRTPDAARAIRFNTGWRDAVASLAGERGLYNDLRTLTWQNLGYRLGRVFGAVPDEVKEAVFALFSEHYCTACYSARWRDEVAQWLTDKQVAVAAKTGTRFFEQAFAHTHQPDSAWFGIHQSVISLVLGNVYLAAISASEGVWLLQTPDVSGAGVSGAGVSGAGVSGAGVSGAGVSNLPRATFKTVRSMPEDVPLVWLRLPDVRDIEHDIERDIEGLLTEDGVWTAYQQAAALLTKSSQATDRDALQVSKGKCRLGDFWHDLT